MGCDVGMGNLEELFVDHLSDLYSAEKQFAKAAPKFASAAETEELKDAFLSHLEKTKEQVERLEQIFTGLKKKPAVKTCLGIKGSLEEAADISQEVEAGMLRDAALIAAAQKIEHYELAGYGSAIEFAKLLGLEESVTLLQETLQEEDLAEKKLAQIAIQVNAEAFVGRCEAHPIR
jgi:ferritin-like metal-binding protein YciE